MAKNSAPLVEFLLAKVDVHSDAVKDLIVAGHTFLILEGQAKEGYVKADALVNSIEGMKLVLRTFFKDCNMTNYPAQEVPYSADSINKEELFKDLVDLFVVYYRIVYSQAEAKYGGAM
ncbi:unnamed protein product [Urochloa humidicola]